MCAAALAVAIGFTFMTSGGSDADRATQNLAEAKPVRPSPVELPTSERPVDGRAAIALAARDEDIPSDFAVFGAWITTWQHAESIALTSLLSRGVELASARRAALRQMIQEDPARALRLALTDDQRAELPAMVREQLERRIHASGDLEVRIHCFGRENHVEHSAVIDGRHYVAHFPRGLAPSTSRRSVPLSGIAMENVLALDPVLSQLAVRGAADSSSVRYLAHSTSIDAGPHLDGPPSPAAATPAGWTIGVKRVLFLRADFPDAPHAVVSESAIHQTMASVSQLYQDMSQGRCSMVATVLPAVLRLPQPKSYYDSNTAERSALTSLKDGMFQQARDYDQANGTPGKHDPANYDRWVLLYNGVSAASTSAAVEAPGVWMDTTLWAGEAAASVLAHELGHNHGCLHATAWRTSTNSPIGAGTPVEYGDPYDVMGQTYSGGHFNVVYKKRLGFLDSSALATATEPGVYRIFRHDHRDASGVRVLRLVTPAGYEYWLEQRQDPKPIGNADELVDRLRRGVLVRWAKYPRTDRYPGIPEIVAPYLLDMTPGSAHNMSDAALKVGESFSSPDGAFILTPIAAGGNAPAEYVDVRVEFLVSVTTQPSPQGAEIAGQTTFQVAASGDGLTYEWRKFGVPIAGATGPSLTLSNLRTRDSGAYSVVVTNARGSFLTRAAMLRVGSHVGPVFTLQPTSLTLPLTLSGSFLVTAGSDSDVTYRWQHNGVEIANSTNPAGNAGPMFPDQVGLYSAIATDAEGSTVSEPAILGLASTVKTRGTATEVGPDIRHPNGNVYDQVLLQGKAATITADAGQIVRMSFLDLTNDIVQVEFSGAGALTVLLDGATGPSPPSHYNQPDVSYMKGHGSIVVVDADATTHLSIFTVGRITAVHTALFRDDVSYDGVADLSFVAIRSRDGKFGSVRAGNTAFWHTRGVAGLYAPGVTIVGPLLIGDINAADAALPYLHVGGATDARITGGDLTQTNGRALDVRGLTYLQFTDGVTSHGTLLPAQPIRTRLLDDEIDVTATLTTNATR